MKTNKINESKLKLIIQERLSLQSTRRKLESYRLSYYSLSYFQTDEFARIFAEWDETRKYNFLRDVGGVYWRNIRDCIGKN